MFVKRVKASLTGSDVFTTSGTWGATGLSVAITPWYADSILYATCYIPDARCATVNGSNHSERTGAFRIYNVTDDEAGAMHIIGRVLTGTSMAVATVAQASPVYADFAVDSLAERVIRLEFKSTIENVLETRIRIDANRWPTLVVDEIRP